MKNLRLAISNDAPAGRDVIWAKPVDGGFALYLMEGGNWQPCVVVDDNATPSPVDDIPIKAIQQVKVNNSKLTPTSKGAVNVKIETGTTSGALKVNGTDVQVSGLVGKGAFADKPASPTEGDMYFCTDKQTTEGSANGIAIFYNGTNWVDALGRTVS